MRSILITVLLSGMVLSIASSCATVPTEPLGPGELRLSSMDVVGSGPEVDTPFAVNVFFEAAGHPEIKRACFFYESGMGRCFDESDVSYVILGTKRALQVHLPGISVGSHWVQCYAEYIRNGETQKTNVIATEISGYDGGHTLF